jgi:hypothetical protein
LIGTYSSESIRVKELNADPPSSLGLFLQSS